MAKQLETATVNRNAVNAISGAITSGLREVNGTGSLLTQVCKVAQQMYRGKAIPKIDVAAILDDLSQRMGWKGPASEVRRSEYKAVLGAYHALPEATAIYRARQGACTWHNGIALARLVNKYNGNAKRAASAYAANRKGKSEPKNGGDAKASAASKLKAVLKLPHLPRAFLTQLRDLCGEYSIKV